MNFWEIIILFFSFQAFLLGTLFMLKGREGQYANMVFGTLLFLYSYNLFFNVQYWARFSEPLFAAVRFTYSLPLSLYGPLFFFYLRHITLGTRISYKDAWHLIPLLLVVYEFGGFYILPLETKMEYVAAGTDVANTRYMVWVYPMIVLLMTGYCLYSYFRFVRYFRNDPEMRIWLRVISGVFFLYAFSGASHAALSFVIDIPRIVDYSLTLFMIALVGLVSYFAFMQPALFNGVALQRIFPLVKYEKTGLPREFSMELSEKLLQLMEREKPYLNSELRLDGIAELLNVSRHHASQIINQHFSVHFFDFVNEYRIREAEKMLRDPKSSLSITDVAFQSGFNNRISFYKAFKKVLGVTPTEYREHSLAS